jgi:WD40 repeat protein
MRSREILALMVACTSFACARGREKDQLPKPEAPARENRAGGAYWNKEAPVFDEKQYPPILGVAFLPDAKQLFSLSEKGLVLWEIGTGKKIRTMEKSEIGFRTLAVSGNGRRVLGGGSTLRLWEVGTGKAIWDPNMVPGIRNARHAEIHTCALSQDGRLALSGANGGENSYSDPLIFWDLQKLTFRVLQGHKASVFSVAFSPDGKLAVSMSAPKEEKSDNSVRVWRLADGACLRTLEDSGGGQVCFSSDGKSILSRALLFRRWDIMSGKLLARSDELKEELKERWFSYSPDNKFCVDHPYPSPRSKETLTLREVSTGKAVWTWRTSTYPLSFGGLWCTAFSHDGKRVAVGGGAQFLQVLDVDTGRLIREFPGLPPAPKSK